MNSLTLEALAAQALAKLRASFALEGHQLLVVRKYYGVRYYEVRRWGQARTFTALRDVHAFRTQIGGAT
ncbi:MAG: hypothetical protein H7255_12245 [Ramlibacter sp.]|uniref:hypothetical protein n=1 Tax=Variovorax sp. RTB1 TaxID=3048631 RepID=UPI001999586E|nr:hypothetical protein [Variovorax sp. RTB1]MBC7603413.1 hypothetical protein [Ramlibacter sp.]MEB0112191.1 hypothetical protein [Variovorax sp. RTB1]